MQSIQIKKTRALPFVFVLLACLVFPAKAQPIEISIQNYMFEPATLEVQTGTTVKWINHEKRASHSMLFIGAEGMESERLFPEESWQRVFDKSGTYSYVCGVHPEMQGRIDVKDTLTSNNKLLMPQWSKKDTFDKVHAGISTGKAAISGDGKYIAVADALPHTLVILDADLQVVKLIPVKDKEGKTVSRISAVYTAASRQSFVAALTDIKEVWEVSYNPTAPEIPMGVIHDFKYREGSFVPGFLNPSRTLLDESLTDFVFSPDHNELIGAAGCTGKGQVIHLDVRRKIADAVLTTPSVGCSTHPSPVTATRSAPDAWHQ